MKEQRSILVLGASGGVGGAVAKAMIARGWRVIGLSRTARPPMEGIEWRVGDALSADDLIRAAEGMDALFYGVNPPRYENWAGVCLPMLKNAVAAAEAAGARLVFPGTVYNFGPDAGDVIDENSPQHPLTRKGAIRVAMETELQAFAARGGRCLILRAGDFFGGTGSSSWFQAALVKPGQAVTSVTYPGDRGIAHAWAYLPDLAETFARLLEEESRLGAFDCFHFQGHWLTGAEMVAALGRVAGHAALPARRFPWWMMVLMSPFISFCGEVLEMRYLWKRPLRLENRKLQRFLGAEPHTPLEEALRRSLVSIGCLTA